MPIIDKKNEIITALPHLQRLVSNIRYLIRNFGITETEFANRCSIPQPTLNRFLTGNTKDPRVSFIIAISENFKIPIGVLFSDEFEKDLSLIKDHFSKLPIISWDDINSNNKTTKGFFISNVTASSKSFCLPGKASFEPRFARDALFIIDPLEKPKDGDFLLVHYIDEGTYTIRQIQIDGATQILKSITSPQTSSEHYDKNKILIKGVVIQIDYRIK